MYANLAELSESRQQLVRHCRKNNFKLLEKWIEQYSDPIAFIYELLQNADDAQASEVVCRLEPNQFEFTHDGNKLFTFDDIDAITAAGASTKENDVNTIGKFGVGFKSVFAITKTPVIQSGEWCFKITGYIVPEEEVKTTDLKNKTAFTLPFDHDKHKPDKLYESISERLTSLQAESLLFLKHIKRIDWATCENDGFYRIDKVAENRADICTQDTDKTRHYLTFNKDVTVGNENLCMTIAYRLDTSKNSEKIIPEDNPPLFVFFPSKNDDIRLKFLAHIPYKTIPSREKVKFDDEENQILTKEFSKFVIETMESVKARKLLDMDFLALLPIDYEIVRSDSDTNKKNPLYVAIFTELKEAISEKNLLPISNGRYANAQNVLLADGPRVKKVLENPDDIELLFGRKFWLESITTNSSGNKGQLSNYLQNHAKVLPKTLRNFCEEISEEFMRRKSDEWIIECFKELKTILDTYHHDHFYMLPLLKSRPIIRLDDGSHICPVNSDGEPQAYLPLPDRNSDFKTVKKTIANDDNDDVIDFLKHLGIKLPNGVSEIKEFIIAKYKDENPKIPKENYIEDLKKVLEIWEKSNPYEKNEIIELIKDAHFIGAVNCDQFFSLRKPDYIYYRTPDLEMWFEGNNDENIYLLDPSIEKYLNDYKVFFDNLSMHKELRVLEVETYRKSKYRTHSYKGFNSEFQLDFPIDDNCHYRGEKGFNPEFEIQGLNFTINNINIERSFYIFKLSLEYYSKLRGEIRESSRIDFDPDKGRQNNTINSMSEPGKLLTKNYWLYDKNYCLIEKNISEISVTDDLHDRYNKQHDNIDGLIEALGLKYDKIRQFEKETGGKFFSLEKNEEYERLKLKEQNEEYERKLMEKGMNESSQESSWKPEVLIENAAPVVRNFVPSASTQKDLSGQTPGTAPTDNSLAHMSTTQTALSDEINNSNNRANSKKIGEYGEEYANKCLKEKYPDKNIDWLNEYTDTGEGYDFLVKDGDEEIYYEIKAKIDEAPHAFEISRTQWNWAKQLHDAGRGDAYIILLVTNTGKPEQHITEIPDPVGKWKAGKLEADPVSIRL